MRAYRVKKRNDRQMAPFGQGLASARLALVAVKCRRPELLIGNRNLNGSRPNLRSKHPADRSSVPSDNTPQLIDESSLISERRKRRKRGRGPLARLFLMMEAQGPHLVG